MVKVVVFRSSYIIFGLRNTISERTAGYFPCNDQINTGTTGTAVSDLAKRTAGGHNP